METIWRNGDDNKNSMQCHIKNKDVFTEEAEKNVRAKGWGGVRWNSVFWTWCFYYSREFTAAVDVCMRPIQDQANQKCVLRKVDDCWALPLLKSYWQLTIGGYMVWIGVSFIESCVWMLGTLGSGTIKRCDLLEKMCHFGDGLWSCSALSLLSVEVQTFLLATCGRPVWLQIKI